MKKDGKILLYIPDARFEYDYLRNKTTLIDVLSDYYENMTQPSFNKVLENKVFTEKNKPRLHWKNYLKQYIRAKKHNKFSRFNENIAERRNYLLEAYFNGIEKKDLDRMYAEVKDNYTDTHVYTFIPESFKMIIDFLYKNSYIELQIDEIYDTNYKSLEFVVVLKK